MPPAASSPELEIRVPLPELIEELSRPEAYGNVTGPVEVVQTHVSAVFLAGNRAYKVKKPIRLWGFLDYGTVEARRAFCETEVRLNRRLAPEIYLGVERIVRAAEGHLEVGGAGDVVEHAVVMVRLPRGATFLERLAGGELGPADVREAAALLARFHGENGLAPEEAGHARPAAFGRVVRQNFLSTRQGVPDLFPARVHAGLARRVARRLAATRHLIRDRVAAGRMVNGHGDVRLEHVVRYEGQVRIIDCVEFSDWIRHVDPLCDMAFLSMDLAERGRWDLARVLETAYVEAAGEDPEVAKALLPLHRAYRAHVRAKVDHQTSLAPEIPAALRAEKTLGARRYLALAWTYARADETPPLIVLHGPSGVGKSTLATAIAPWLDAEVLRTDVVRKELAGLAPTARPDEEGSRALYTSAMSARTYGEILVRAERAIRAGRAALLDATWLRRDSRAAARALALRLGAPFAIVDVTCDDREIRRRLEARQAAGTDPSDADVAVYEEQVRRAETFADEERPFTVGVPSSAPPEQAVLEILDHLEASL